MILSRRRAHFYSSITLICLLPLGFLAAMLLFPKYQATEGADVLFKQAGFAIAGSETDGAENKGEQIASTALKNKSAQLQAQTFWRQDDQKTPVLLELEPVRDIRRPDLLVYWVNEEEKSTQAESNPESTPSSRKEESPAIGENFILLGKLSGPSRRAFPLPRDIYGKEGRLILYSQVQQFRVAEFPFPTHLTAIDR